MAPKLSTVIAIGVGVLIAGCANETPSAQSSGVADLKFRADYYYAGAARIEPETGRIDLDWTITVDGDDEEITFILNRSLGGFEVEGASVVSFNVEEVETFGGSTALNVKLLPAEGDEARAFSLSYGGVLLPEPMQNNINTISPDKIELTVDSFWTPFDARIDRRFTADLDLFVGGAWTIVTPGDVREDGEKISIRFDLPAFDLPVMLLKGETRTDAPGYIIHDTRAVRDNVPALINAAGFCTDYLNGEFSRVNPLPTAQMVIHDRSIGGYSRKTVIALTDIGKTEEQPLLQFICHELAHFWSTAADFTSADHWMTESIADYAAIMALREAYGEAAFEARLQSYRDQIAAAEGGVPPIWTADNAARGPYLVNYRKGPLALARLEAMIGPESFKAFLLEYMARPITTTPDLIAALEEIAGPDVRAAFETMLGE